MPAAPQQQQFFLPQAFPGAGDPGSPYAHGTPMGGSGGPYALTAAPGGPGNGAMYPAAPGAAYPTAVPGAYPAAIPGYPAGFPGAAGPYAAGPYVPGAPMQQAPGAAPYRFVAAPPPPRARPARPPAPPIPTGRVFDPQWNEMAPFSDNRDAIITMNIWGPPEGIWWGKKTFRDAMAKAAGVTADRIFWHRVLPSQDDAGRSITEVTLVIQSADPAAIIGKLSVEANQINIKNRIEEVDIEMIGNTFKALAPSVYTARQKDDRPVPASSAMITDVPGMSGPAAGSMGAPGMGASLGMGMGMGMGMGPAAGGPGMGGGAALGMGPMDTGLGAPGGNAFGAGGLGNGAGSVAPGGLDIPSAAGAVMGGGGTLGAAGPAVMGGPTLGAPGRVTAPGAGGTKAGSPLRRTRQQAAESGAGLAAVSAFLATVVACAVMALA